jgi:hypothetical protein
MNKKAFSQRVKTKWKTNFTVASREPTFGVEEEEKDLPLIA